MAMAAGIQLTITLCISKPHGTPKEVGFFRFYYDSDRLIKGIRTSLDISYMPDQAYYFYGYNGYEAVYNEDWTNTDDFAI